MIQSVLNEVTVYVDETEIVRKVTINGQEIIVKEIVLEVDEYGITTAVVKLPYVKYTVERGLIQDNYDK